MENVHTIPCDASTVCNTVYSQSTLVSNTASSTQSVLCTKEKKSENKSDSTASGTSAEPTSVSKTALSSRIVLRSKQKKSENKSESTNSKSSTVCNTSPTENDQNDAASIASFSTALADHPEQAANYSRYVPKGIKNSKTACFVNVALQLLFINPYIRSVFNHILSDRQLQNYKEFRHTKLLEMILDLYVKFDDDKVLIHDEQVELRKKLPDLDSFDESILEGQEDTVLIYMGLTQVIDEYTQHRYGYMKVEESERVYHTPNRECTACREKQDTELTSTEIYLSPINILDKQGNLKTHDPMGLDDLIDQYYGPRKTKEECGSTTCNYANRELKTFTEFNLIGKMFKTYKFRINRFGPEMEYNLLDDNGNLQIDKKTGKYKVIKEFIKLDYKVGYPEIWKPANQCFPNGLCLELYAVVYHVGEQPFCGHYVCDIKNWITKQWYTCDDNDIRELKHSSAISDLKYWNRLKKGRNFNNNTHREKSRKQQNVACLFYFDQNSFNTFTA